MNDEGFVIDHVIYGVVDIDAASERLREEHGLGSVAGIPHLGGTSSRIVPLGPECFLELLGIEDTSKDDGAWLEATLRGQDRVLWWCLGVSDLDDTAARRGLPGRGAGGDRRLAQGRDGALGGTRQTASQRQRGRRVERDDRAVVERDARRRRLNAGHEEDRLLGRARAGRPSHGVRSR